MARLAEPRGSRLGPPEKGRDEGVIVDALRTADRGSHVYMAGTAARSMPTYIVLGHLTHQAKRNRTESLKMRDKLWDEYRKKGLKFTAYDTLGPYDVVTIVDSPSEELAFKYLGAAGESGNIETTTLRAFSAEEAQRIKSG